MWVAISFSRDLSNPGIETLPPLSPTWQDDSLSAEPLLHFIFILVKAKCEKRFVLKADFFLPEKKKECEMKYFQNLIIQRTGHGRKIIPGMCH